MTTGVQEAAERVCRNCGATLTGAYCAACGQSAHIHRSLRGLVEEVAQDVVRLDLRIGRTFPLLVFRPGKLTRDYMEGRRASYVSPIGMFLFALFVMLFVLGTLDSLGLPAPASVEGANPARSGVTAMQVQDLGYKLSFLIVPVSLPFVALLFLNRRQFTLFDHCVFLFYSVSFMLLLFLVRTVLERIDQAFVADYLTPVFQAIVVAHILFQVKGAYSLGWLSAVWRTFALLLIAAFTLTLYVAALFGGLILMQ